MMLSLLLFNLPTYAVFDLTQINTYQGQVITPASLTALSQHNLPDEVKQKTEEWLNKNPEIVQKVIQQNYEIKSLEDFKRIYEENKRLLEQNNITFIPSNNHILDNVIPGYVIKISPLHLRVNNILVGVNRSPDDQLPRLFDKISEETTVKKIAKLNALLPMINTYQTASRAATALRLEEYAENNPHITPIPTHVITIPGCPADAADKHCIVLEQKMTTVRQLGTLKDPTDYFTPEGLIALLQAIQYAGVWNLTSSNIFINDNDQFLLPDGEYPDNTNPSTFFHNDKDKFLWNIGCGFEQLWHQFPHNSKQREIIKEFVISDKNLQQSRKFPELIRLVAPHFLPSLA